MKKKFVVITWDDAHANLDASTEQELQAVTPERTYSVGWLVAKNQHGCVIAMDSYESDEKEFMTTAFILTG